MRRTVDVLLGDDPGPVGLLRYEAQGGREAAAFEFAAGWLEAPDRFSFDPELALVGGSQFHRRRRDGAVFHGAVADTEPDGWARRVILRDHAKRRAAPRGERAADPGPLSSLDFLLAVDDFSRVGALRFRDEQGVFQRALERGRRTAPPLVELGALLSATRAVETNTETAADLEYLRGRGTSVGGMRPKCTVVDDEGRLSIGKFPSVADERSVTKGEVLALRLAAAAGVDVSRARIVASEGVPVALIERFDRRGDGTRIPYISAATMLGVDAADGEDHAYTEIVDGLRRHGARPKADIEQLWRRIAFSIAITNVDDHLANHGFLHAGKGRWRLSPAFDVNPFPDRARELKTWISEESGPAASMEALLLAAPYFQIKPTRARAIVAEVKRAVTRWRETGRELGMTKRELEAFAPAFVHDALA